MKETAQAVNHPPPTAAADTLLPSYKRAQSVLETLNVTAGVLLKLLRSVRLELALSILIQLDGFARHLSSLDNTLADKEHQK